MIVIDIETTGTNPQKHSIISIGAVDMDMPEVGEGRFYLECRVWDGAHIEQEALAINGMSELQIHDPQKPTEGEAVRQFFAWLMSRRGEHGHVLAGHIPAFDLGFLQAAAAREHIDFILPKRSIDQHTLVWAHMLQRGQKPPLKNQKSVVDSDFTMRYVGIPTEPKPHIALNGAVWEAEAISRLLYGRSLLDQFSKYPIPWA